jgi:hypothetical protein
MLFRSAENLCSSCNKTESGATTKNLRLGPEIKVCKYCGNACDATAHEWAHFRETERRESFISDDLLWILYVFPWLGLALASLYNRHGSINWIGFIWGLLATLPWLAITWWWKIREIRKSLEQSPPDAYSNLEPRSLFPWKSVFKTKGGSFRKL